MAPAGRGGKSKARGSTPIMEDWEIILTAIGAVVAFISLSCWIWFCLKEKYSRRQVKDSMPKGNTFVPQPPCSNNRKTSRVGSICAVTEASLKGAVPRSSVG